MDDLLSRMLEIEAQGNATVKEAEAKAAEIRQAGSVELAKLNSEFSAALAAECDALEANAMAEARREYDRVIAEAKVAIAKSEAEIAGLIAPKEEELFREVLGL